MISYGTALLSLLLVLFAGLFSGAALANIKWTDNAERIQRLNHKGYFYKVVRLGNPKSHEYMSVHWDECPATADRKVVAWECSGEPGLYDNITRSKGEADHHRKIGRSVRPLIYGDTHPDAPDIGGE